jgi:hypothetical protein
VRCEWADGPPPRFHHGVSSFPPEDRTWATAEADRCLGTGAFVRATCLEHVSRAFIVEHNGKRRLVLNFKFVNEFERKRSVRFQSLSSFRRHMRRDDWVWSIDLSDAYHHIGIYPPDQKYFTFALETDRGTEYFSCAALSFGWTRSPQYFTDVMKPVVSYLRNQHVSSSSSSSSGSPSPTPAHLGLRVLPWLDDFAFFAQRPSLAAAEQSRDFSYAVIDDLGLSRNLRKGQHEVSHRLDDHLGYLIDLERGQFGLTVRREAKLRSGATALLCRAARDRRLVPARQLASFAGLAQSSGLALRLARCWLRAPFDDLASARRWSGLARLSRQSMADIRQFTRLRGSHLVGRDIWRPADSALGFVDAGPRGWGGVLSSPSRPPVAGFWSAPEAALHITWRELRAVRLFIAAYLPDLAGRRLLLREDNQAVVAIIASLTSRSPELMAETRLLVELLDEHEISLRALYIRSEENVVADFFSRIARPREYILSTALVAQLFRWWGPCSVDAFASAASAQLPRFWAEAPTAGAEAVDAFAQDWTRERAWAHPPPHMLPQLCQLLREAPAASAIVCAPCWPGAAWYAELMELSTEWVSFPPGSLQRVAFDAPPLLETWAVSAFLIPPRV